MPPSPVAIISFNRPHLLAEVLASIRSQEPRCLEGREFHLFQDGAVNRYSRIRYAADADILRCVGLFQEAFPDGIVHAFEDNIGICENFQRAERYLFIERGFDSAWFFEDDLVLSRAYFEMMDRLEVYARTVDHVAYFAAYGDHYVSRADLVERGRSLTTLDHHWGFGLLARHWRSMQDQLQPFYDIVVGTDYARRDHRRIFGLYESLDAAPPASSQDAAKAFACARLGLWRCNTVQPFARYIGESGAHMTPDAFAVLGFSQVDVAQEPISDLRFPGGPEIREFVVAARERFRAVRREEFAGILASLPPRALNPNRVCTRDDIDALYHLLLRRRVENAAVYEAHVSRRPEFVLLQAILASEEFKALLEPDVENATFRDATFRSAISSKEIFSAYCAILQREPESEVLAQHAGVTPLDIFTQGLLRSTELRELKSTFVY